MTITEIAKLFKARREGRNFRAKCPVHRSKGVSMGIYAKEDRTILVCYAGCLQDDILASVGLTWKDTLYRQPDSQEWKKLKREKQLRDEVDRNLRIGNWIVQFIHNGYTREDRDSDVTAIAASALALVEKPSPTWERVLENHMERLVAAEVCRTNKMLPRDAKPKFSLDTIR